jgi:arylsulfate sulfotransferase
MRNLTHLYLLALCSVLFFTNCSTYYPLDEPIPEAVVKQPTGEFLVSPSGYRNPTSGIIAIYDKSGNMMKQIDIGSTSMDFKKWVLADGKVRYSYLKFDKNVPHMAGVGYNAGDIIILDQDFQEIKKITLLPHADRTAADNNALDGHDFILISDTHYIAMAYFEKKVNNIPSILDPTPNCRVAAPIIQEVENGKVIWEWDGTNEPELYETSVELNNFSTGTTPQDYAHLNAMYIDPKDNNLVLSFRNMNQILKLERNTNKILWRLGGKNSDFPITTEQKFLRQHDAHFLADGKTIILFDNGDLKERPYTRIVEFTLDEKNKKITNYKSMYLPDRSFTQFMGSVIKTDSTYFIGCGGDPRVMEVNLATGQKIFEQKLALPSYRAYRY